MTQISRCGGGQSHKS